MPRNPTPPAESMRNPQIRSQTRENLPQRVQDLLKLGGKGKTKILMILNPQDDDLSTVNLMEKLFAFQHSYKETGQQLRGAALVKEQKNPVVAIVGSEVVKQTAAFSTAAPDILASPLRLP